MSMGPEVGSSTRVLKSVISGGGRNAGEGICQPSAFFFFQDSGACGEVPALMSCCGRKGRFDISTPALCGCGNVDGEGVFEA